MPRKPGPKKVRVQLDFLRGAYDELIQLQGEVDAPSLVETVRYSLRTLQWLTSTIRSGAVVLVEKDGKQQRVVFPFIRNSVPTYTDPQVARNEPATVS